MLELADDLSADWIFDLWEVAPTPEKTARVREATVARILKKHRIRRFDAAHVRSELCKPALSVAQGTTEAATSHIRVAVERLRLIHLQLVSNHSATVSCLWLNHDGHCGCVRPKGRAEGGTERRDVQPRE